MLQEEVEGDDEMFKAMLDSDTVNPLVLAIIAIAVAALCFGGCITDDCGGGCCIDVSAQAVK